MRYDLLFLVGPLSFMMLCLSFTIGRGDFGYCLFFHRHYNYNDHCFSFSYIVLSFQLLLVWVDFGILRGPVVLSLFYFH